MSLSIHVIPIFEDNYVWLIQAADSAHVLVLDPGDAEPILAYIAQHDLIPVALLITHRDYDHIDGILPFLEHYDVPVFGPVNDEIPAINTALVAQDNLTIDAHFPAIDVIDVPGHTPGHIAYLIEGRLFCGDALFTAGCGRVRLGAYEKAHDSLNRLAKLPVETVVYCSHEYTVANLQFAKTVEPDNQAIQKRLIEANALRADKQKTIPSTIGLELATNPFLRCEELVVKQAAEHFSKTELSTEFSVFKALRLWKDQFKG